MKKELVIMVILFATALFLHLYPSFIWPYPLRFDSYFHARVAPYVFSSTIPWPYGGRPFFYPPLYHILIDLFSTISDPLTVVRFLLPFITALYPVLAYWLLKEDKERALITAFLFTITPFFFSSDSPEALALTFIFPTLFYLKRNQTYTASLFFSLIALSSFFAFTFIALVFAIYILLRKRYNYFKLFSAPIIILLLLSPFSLRTFTCLNNNIGPLFIYKAIHFDLLKGALFLIPMLALCLMKKPKDEEQWFFLIWLLLAFALFMSFLFTYQFHPWRYPFYISFAFTFLLPPLISNISNHRKLLALAGVGIFYLALFYQMSGTFSPGVPYHNIEALRFIGSKYSPLLAYHDPCAVMQTVSNGSCYLDIWFECIPNPEEWKDFEMFFWYGHVADVKKFFERHPDVKYIFYASTNPGQVLIKSLNVSHPFEVWACNPECTMPGGLYVR